MNKNFKRLILIAALIVLPNLASAFTFPASEDSWNPGQVIPSAWADALEHFIGTMYPTSSTPTSLSYRLLNGLFGNTATTTVVGDNGTSTFKNDIIGRVVGFVTGEFGSLKATTTAPVQLAGPILDTFNGTSSFSGGISITGSGLTSSQGLVISAGDLLVAGKIVSSNSGATSSIAGGLSAGQLSVAGIEGSGRLNISSSATSSFTGGLTVANLSIIGGLQLGARLACNGSSALQTDSIGVIQCGTISGFPALTDNNPHVILTDVTDRFGIGTTTPGAALSVQDEADIGRLFVEDHIRTGSIIATSTTATNIFLGNIGSSGQRVPNIFATNVDTTLITVSAYAQGGFVTNGNLTVSGGTFSLGNGSATSTFSAIGTTTTIGGINISTQGFKVSAGGLDITGDALFNGPLKVLTTGTSTFAGDVAAAKSVSFETGGDDVLTVSESSATLTFDCEQHMNFTAVMTGDDAISIRAPLSGRWCSIDLFTAAGGDFQPNWSTSSAALRRPIFSGYGTTTLPVFEQNRYNRCIIQTTSTSASSTPEATLTCLSRQPLNG